jgi:hypothetical protein
MIAEKLISSIPEEYKDGVVLTDFVTAIAPDLQVVQDKIDSLGTVLSVDTADHNLDWLLERVGWTVGEHYPVHVKREALKNHARWDKHYGQSGILEEIFEIYTRPTANGHGVKAEFKPKQNPIGGWRVNSSYVGRNTYVSTEWSINDLRIRILSFGDNIATSDFLKRLKGILEQIVPMWMIFDVSAPDSAGGWYVGRRYVERNTYALVESGNVTF